MPFWIPLYPLCSREGTMQVSPRSLWYCRDTMLLPNKLHRFSYYTELEQRDAQCESRYGLACLLRMPNMAAIVTKIDIQILRLLSWLQCLFFFFFFFPFFVFFFHRAAAWQEKGDEMMAGGEGAEGSLSCTPYVVSFGASLVSVYAWQVLAPSLCSWCLCTRLCQHPPAPLPPEPGTARRFTAQTPWQCNELENRIYQ